MARRTTINILSVKNTVISTRFVDDRPLSALLSDAAQAYAIASVVVVVSGLTAMEFLSHWGACSYNTITSDKQSARTEHCELADVSKIRLGRRGRLRVSCTDAGV